MPPTFFSRIQFPDCMASFDTIIRVVLAVYIAALPFKSLLFVQRNGFILVFVLLAGWCVANQKFFYSRTPYDMLLLAVVVWVGLTVPFSVVPSYSLKEYFKLLQHIVVFYAVIFFFEKLRTRQVLLGLIGIIAFAVTAYGLSQFNLQNSQAVMSFLSAEVWLTTFLIMVIPFALVLALGEGPPGVRGGGAIVAGMMLVCLLSTQSRAGMVALVGELWVIAYFIRSGFPKIVAAFVTVCLVVIAIFVFNNGTMLIAGVNVDLANLLPVKKGFGSVFHRFEIWGFVLSEIVKHWLVGIGYGTHSYLFLYAQDGEVIRPGHSGLTHAGTHNIVLYLALHLGIPGLLLFGWLFTRVILRTAAEYLAAHDWLSRAVLLGTVGSVVGLILRLQFDQMFVGSLAVFFWVLLALAVLTYPSYNRSAGEARV